MPLADYSVLADDLSDQRTTSDALLEFWMMIDDMALVGFTGVVTRLEIIMMYLSVSRITILFNVVTRFISISMIAKGIHHLFNKSLVISN